MTQASDMNFFESEDGRLAYRDIGSGTPVVLLHGGYLDHRMWDEQVAVLSPVCRVIVPDVRGHGLSANASRPYRQADDLAALLRHLGTGPALLVGLSMGGGIAVDTALEHPELVRALVVSGAGTSEAEFQDPWVTGIQGELARATAEGDAGGFVDAFVRYTTGPHRTLDDVDGEVLRRIREMGESTVAKHVGTVPVLPTPVTDTWARAAKIAVPVLAINGSLDSDDCVGMAERLVAIVPDGRTTTVEGTGHYPNMERPALFNEFLWDFLCNLSTGRG
ncbi:alpha/beta fold hydrolase [Streptomyces sp. NPDC057654]|uniref:alpha/beta fold hydrolase n=1 Tax=Streptomyces sp. NPDC057654 TaxID=3346196 RepID=UPI0036893F98